MDLSRLSSARHRFCRSLLVRYRDVSHAPINERESQVESLASGRVPNESRDAYGGRCRPHSEIRETRCDRSKSRSHIKLGALCEAARLLWSNRAAGL